METTQRRPWRRWILLALMIAGFILGGIFIPIQPEITVAAERLSETPLFTLPAPFGPFYLVNTIPSLALTIVLLLAVAYFTSRSLKKSETSDLTPRGIGNLMEAFLELIYNLTEGSAGSKWAKAIFPWFATIMIYVLFVNLLKLIPGFESIGVLHHTGEGHAVAPLFGNWSLLSADKGEYILAPFFRGGSVDLNFTLAIALIAVVMTQVLGIQAHGISYFSKFFNIKNVFKVPFFGVMDLLVGLLEIISEFSKILSFAFRLFGNMFAGLVLVAIIATLLGKISIVPSMILLFELFVGIIQAFVFGILTMVFMVQATQGHGSEEHKEAPAVENAEAHLI